MGTKDDVGNGEDDGVLPSWACHNMVTMRGDKQACFAGWHQKEMISIINWVEKH